MKKVLYLLLTLVLVMGLAACGSSKEEEAAGSMEGDTPEVIAVLKINTEGMGQIAYGLEGEDIEFNDEFPEQSAMVNLTEPGTYVIKAKADDGWKFVKWTKDGEDFSEEADITVEAAEDAEYIAVFETE